jgi:hypothetical protein
MAEREGFEPSIEFPLYTLSKRAPSTTRPSLHQAPEGAAPTKSAASPRLTTLQDITRCGF